MIGEVHNDLERIGNRSKDGVFVYKIDKKAFAYVNEAFAGIFSTQKEELLANPQLALKHVLTEDHQYLQGRFNELLTDGSINTTEFRLSMDKGDIVHLSCDMYMLDDNTVAGFIKDITGDKEHENYLVEITAQKDSFLDMITHNLSGPLILSQNLLSWVQRSIKAGDTKNVESLLNMLQESTQECIDIVDDFLVNEHKESQGIFVRKTRFSVVDKINTVLEKLQELSPEKHFRLSVNIADNYINTDSVKFFQIIHNLISNAIKFTGPQGHIDITIGEDIDSYTFTVADDGIGIPDQLKPHVFEKKSIAGRQGLKGERSHGVGLSIIKKLTDIIGGKLWFDSSENTGTTFYLQLPKE